MTATAQAGVRYALAMLFLINFLNFFDRAIPAVVLEPIRKEFNLDDTWLGLLGTSFTLIYALAGLPLGRLSDKMRRTWVLSGGVFVWSLLTAASGAAWNFVSFFLIRLGVGVGEASCAPASNSMIGDMYPSQQRARALGLFMLGLPLGQLASFALVGYLAQLYGWRMPFLYRGGAGVGDRPAGVDPSRADSRFPRGLQGGRHGADRPALSAHPDVPDALVDHFLRRYSQFRRLRNGHLPSLADDPLP